MNEKKLTQEDIDIILSLINTATIRVADIPTVQIIVQKLLMLRERTPLDLEDKLEA